MEALLQLEVRISSVYDASFISGRLLVLKKDFLFPSCPAPHNKNFSLLLLNVNTSCNTYCFVAWVRYFSDDSLEVSLKFLAISLNESLHLTSLCFRMVHSLRNAHI